MIGKREKRARQDWIAGKRERWAEEKDKEVKVPLNSSLCMVSLCIKIRSVHK